MLFKVDVAFFFVNPGEALWLPCHAGNDVVMCELSQPDKQEVALITLNRLGSFSPPALERVWASVKIHPHTLRKRLGSTIP